MTASGQGSGGGAERAILWIFLLLMAVAWIGLGGLIFVGILQNASGG